ncbi:MAG: guanylate kinase [Mucinivorans sp.]
MGKALIFSAPSGSGKTTIVRHLLKQFPQLEFSISATSRAPRTGEKDGVDYYFLTNEQFSQRVENGEFLEWEQVYAGTSYGTLLTEIRRIWDKGGVVVFDVDVVGGVNIKRAFGESALSIFIMPPSIESLEKRLIARDTDSPEAIVKRVAKAEHEMTYASKFDKIIVRDSSDGGPTIYLSLIRHDSPACWFI